MQKKLLRAGLAGLLALLFILPTQAQKVGLVLSGGGANRIYAPAYWRFDAFASYAFNDRVDLQLNVQNVGDKDYIIRTNGTHHADYGNGRQAILTLNAKF